MNRRAFLILAFGAARTPAQEAVFRVGARLVEVYATVRDAKGRYIEGLKREDLQIAEDGQLRPVETVEENADSLSCAVVLDTTGSMSQALGTVKNAFLRLVSEFRSQDSIALYSFAGSVQRLQDFTTDRAALKRAVLGTRASGRTALFDAISSVSGAVSKREGMKAIVLFTDGNDNASFLSAPVAIRRAKAAGVPIYAVAQGDAVQQERLMRQLMEISNSTGGRCYAVQNPQGVESVFEAISAEVKHTYLIAYRPPASGSSEWRAIALQVKGHPNYRIRAREGYFPE